MAFQAGASVEKTVSSTERLERLDHWLVARHELPDFFKKSYGPEALVKTWSSKTSNTWSSQPSATFSSATTRAAGCCRLYWIPSVVTRGGWKQTMLLGSEKMRGIANWLTSGYRQVQKLRLKGCRSSSNCGTANPSSSYVNCSGKKTIWL